MKVYDANSEIAQAGLEGFFESFMHSRLHELQILTLALDKLDYSTLLRIAHQWKGYSVPYGFGKLEHLAVELEDSAYSENIERCRSLLHDVYQYLEHKKASSREF
jgi:HPt (histidine-containing phosphotransfer) domain-containing protein